MTFKQNLTKLNAYLINAPTDANRKRIKKIISLYEDKKIPNIQTAVNVCILLISKHKATIPKAIKTYDELVAKYEAVQPMTGRLTNYTNVKEVFIYDIRLIFYGSAENVSQQQEEQEEQRAKKTKGRYFKGMRQITLGTFQVKINYPLSTNISEFLNTYYRTLLTIDPETLQRLGRSPSDENTSDFLKNDPSFQNK